MPPSSAGASQSRLASSKLLAVGVTVKFCGGVGKWNVVALTEVVNALVPLGFVAAIR